MGEGTWCGGGERPWWRLGPRAAGSDAGVWSWAAPFPLGGGRGGEGWIQLPRPRRTSPGRWGLAVPDADGARGQGHAGGMGRGGRDGDLVKGGAMAAWEGAAVVDRLPACCVVGVGGAALWEVVAGAVAGWEAAVWGEGGGGGSGRRWGVGCTVRVGGWGGPFVFGLFGWASGC
nr:uncharacterized PE-PGRS family protein PE_PGRS54-like [Aegilops tauschii subsp. strangulata]